MNKIINPKWQALGPETNLRFPCHEPGAYKIFVMPTSSTIKLYICTSCNYIHTDEKLPSTPVDGILYGFCPRCLSIRKFSECSGKLTIEHEQHTK